MAAFRYQSMATLLLLSTLLLSTSAQISIDTKNMPTDHELLHEMSEAQRSSGDPLRSMTNDMPDGFNIGKDQRAERAEEAGKYNVAFEAAYLIADVDRCLNILLKSKRMGEAAFFAKAYAPSRLAEVTKSWGNYL